MGGGDRMNVEEKVDIILAKLKEEKEKMVNKFLITMILSFIIKKGLEDELTAFARDFAEAQILGTWEVIK